MTAKVASVSEDWVADLAMAEEGPAGRLGKVNLDLAYQVVGYQDRLGTADNPADCLPT